MSPNMEYFFYIKYVYWYTPCGIINEEIKVWIPNMKLSRNKRTINAPKQLTSPSK